MKLIAPSPWLVISWVSALVFVVTLIVVVLRVLGKGRVAMTAPISGLLVGSLLTALLPWLVFLDLVILLATAGIRSRFVSKRPSSRA